MVDIKQRTHDEDELAEIETYDGNWKHLWLAMYEDAFERGAKVTKDSTKWQDLILEKLEAQKAKPAEQECYNTGLHHRMLHVLRVMQDRAAELRKTGETHSIGSELARMRYNFAAAQIEKLAEELKSI